MFHLSDNILKAKKYVQLPWACLFRMSIHSLSIEYSLIFLLQNTPILEFSVGVY